MSLALQAPRSDTSDLMLILLLSRRTFRCKHPGCTTTCHTASGLSKHKKKHTAEGGRELGCSQCEYTSNRRDILRQHFLRQHGPELPVSLQETRRGFV